MTSPYEQFIDREAFALFLAHRVYLSARRLEKEKLIRRWRGRWISAPRPARGLDWKGCWVLRSHY